MKPVDDISVDTLASDAGFHEVWLATDEITIEHGGILASPYLAGTKFEARESISRSFVGPISRKGWLIRTE